MKNLNSGGVKSGKVRRESITINTAGIPNLQGSILSINRNGLKEYVRITKIEYPKSGDPIITAERL